MSVQAQQRSAPRQQHNIPRQTARTFVFGVLALASVIAAAVCFMPLWDGALWLPGMILAFVGMAIMGAVVWGQSGTRAEGVAAIAPPAERLAPLTRRDWLTTGAGAAALIIVTALQFRPQTPERLQFALIVTGMALLITGLAGLRRRDTAALVGVWRGTPRWVWLSLGGVFVTALAIRLYRLETALRVLVDEMQNIAPVVRMWETNFPLLQQIYYPDYPYTFLYPYMQQAGSYLFGYSLFTLRVPNAIYGALSVFALYWLVSLLFEDRQLGVLSAFALAVFPLHMQFSRIGIMNLYDPTLAALAFAFVVRGVRYNLRRDWVLAGAMLGVIHYVYEGGRLLQTPLLLLWAFLLVLWLWQHANPLQVARGLAWTVGVSVLLAAPMYITWLGMSSPAFGRLHSENLTKVRLEEAIIVRGGGMVTFDTRTNQITQNFIDSYALYVTKVDEWMFYGGDQPMILPFVQPFFLLGLAASLFMRRRWGYTVLPALWVLVTVTLLGLFIWNPLHVARHTVAMLAMAVLIALGVWWTAKLLIRDARRQVIAAWLVMFVLGGAQVVYYFGYHLPLYNYQARDIRGDYADPDDAILRASTLPANTEVYVITEGELFPRWHPKYFMLYLTHGDVIAVHVWLEEWLWGDILSDLAPEHNHAFFVESRNGDLIEEITTRHPYAQPSFSRDPHIDPMQQFVLLYVPSAALFPSPPPEDAP